MTPSPQKPCRPDEVDSEGMSSCTDEQQLSLSNHRMPAVPIPLHPQLEQSSYKTGLAHIDVCSKETTSSDLKEQVLLDLLQRFKDECEVAQRRHSEIVSRLVAQQNTLKGVSLLSDSNVDGPSDRPKVYGASEWSRFIRPAQPIPRPDSPIADKKSNSNAQSTQVNLEFDAQSQPVQWQFENQVSPFQRDSSKPAALERQMSPEQMTPALSTKEPTQDSTLQATLNTISRSNRLLVSQAGLSSLGAFPDHAPKNTLLALAACAVRHRNFEFVFAAVIMVNALVLCFEVQYEGLQFGYDLQLNGMSKSADRTWPSAKRAFALFDWIFGIVLSLEVLLRIVGHRWRYIYDVWNALDWICIFSFLVDKVASTLVPISRQTIQLMRLFRLLRLIRLIRTLEGLDALYLLTTAIRGMRSILTWTVLLLSVLMMTCALFLTQVLHSFYFSGLEADDLLPEEMETRSKIFRYFGTFTRCMFSMFELTLANYPPVARLLAEEVSEWFMGVCLIHKLTIGLAVIGVMNGVILQETFKVAATDDLIMVRQRKRAASVLHTKMTTFFKALDSNGDGRLDYNEFEIIASHPEVRHWLASLDIETDDLRTLFLLVDADDSGTISVDELVHRIPRLRGPARSLDVMALREGLRNGRTMDISPLEEIPLRTHLI